MVDNLTPAKFPRIGSMQSRILATLLEGERITTRDILFEAATYEVSTRVSELKKLGWPIQGNFEEVLTKDPTGRKSRVKRYFIETENIRLLQPEIHEFINKVKAWEVAASQARKTGSLKNQQP